MTGSNWAKIEEVFQAALDLAPAKRSRFIDEQCGDDKELKAQVEKLVAQSEQDEDFLESPVWTDSKMLQSTFKRNLASSIEKEISADNTNDFIGQRIGAYRLTKELGRGGMGAVYLAERADGEFQQQVAVKLIKRGMDTEFIIKRFRHERQILATLDHPNIARLLDGGTTGRDLPYFVMEYVNGEPLYQYCDEHQLSIRKRLQLILQVCSAVQAAHERQVIHRDIKPGNIIVTLSGTPKLLDFGIAKILDPDLIHESLNPTSTMMRLMTPDYASPEQVRGSEITPASDVYGLGVLIYELLTGHRPYNFAGRSPHEISRVICETDPILPSKAVAKPKNLLASYVQRKISAEEAARLRGTDIKTLQNDLAEGLDNLILKTLCKEPAGRYESVKSLAQDISRYLDGQPITAEPCTADKEQPVEKNTHTSYPTGSRSIAVLPFKLLTLSSGEDTENSFLGVGLADALISRLSNIPRFIVRPTSSVLRFGERNFDPFLAGNNLNVEYILDGHIQKVGERIRVSVQLLNVAENSTIWAQRYNEKFTDVLSLEDLISTQVAESLVPHLSSDEREILSKRGTNNPDAFEAYLHGRYYWNTFTEEGFAKAIVAYNQAIAHDTNYALAYAGIADYYNWLGVYGILPAYECFQAAKAAALKAVELDEKLSEAHAALGFAVVGGDYDWNAGERHCRRALDLNPHSATAQVWYSLQLTMEARFEEGIFHAKRGIELDPLSGFNSYNLGWCQYFARQFEDSIETHRRTVTTFPNYFLAHYGLCWTLRYLGRSAEALEQLEKAKAVAGNSPFLQTAYGQTLAAAGRSDEAKKVLAELSKTATERFVSPYQMALIYAFLQDKEKTLEFLEESLEQRESWMVWMGVEPALDFLQGEARFQKVLEKTGNPAFHRAQTIAFVSEQPSTGGERIDRVSSTDGGSAPTREIVTEPAPARRQFNWLIPVLAVLMLGAVFFAVRLFRQSAASPVPPISANDNRPRTLAVLPFKPTGAKFDGDEYLGTGTADLVTSKLSQLSQLKLRSPSALRKYSQTDQPAAEIGRELTADYVVSGTVEQKDDKSVNVNLVMTDVAAGGSVWTQTFTNSSDNLFALQETISQKIAESLGLQLSGSEKDLLAKPLTANNEAYQFYLAGLYHLGKRDSENFKTAISYFERAVEADPNFAYAYAGLADTYALMRLYPPAPPNAYLQAREFATKALQLDDSLAEAHAALGLVAFYGDRKFTESEKQLRRAVELNPNYATAHQWLALTLAAESRFDEALGEVEKARQLDPQSLFVEMANGNILFYARQHFRAEQKYKEILKRDQTFTLAYIGQRRALEMQGQYDEAAKVFEQERPLRSNDGFYLKLSEAELAAAANRREDTVKALNEAFALPEAQSQEREQSYYIATIYALLGDIDQTMKYLKIAEDEKRSEIDFINVSPFFDKVRDDKKFVEFRNSVLQK